MPTHLIQLKDGILVEVDRIAGAVAEAAEGAVHHVDQSIDDVTPILTRVGQAVAAAWHALSTDVTITETQIALGLSFAGEGDIYVTKATAGANLVITLTLKPPEEGAS